MDLAHLHAVGRRLRLGDKAVGPPGILPHRPGQGEGVDHGLDIRQGAVLVVVVLIIMVMGMPMTLFMTMDRHPHMGTGDPLPPYRFRLQRHAGKQGVHIRQEPLLLRAQLVERAHEHVPRRAHGALQIQRSHSDIPFI